MQFHFLIHSRWLQKVQYCKVQKSLCCKFEQQLLDKPARLKYFSEFAKVNQNNYKCWDHNAAFSLISLWPLDHHGNITFSQNLESALESAHKDVSKTQSIPDHFSLLVLVFLQFLRHHNPLRYQKWQFTKTIIWDYFYKPNPSSLTLVPLFEVAARLCKPIEINRETCCKICDNFSWLWKEQTIFWRRKTPLHQLTHESWGTS